MQRNLESWIPSILQAAKSGFHIFTPWYQRSGSETTPQAIRFFFPAWLENGNESSPFCPFQIDHCTSVSNQTSASPKLRGVRHLGKSLGVLRKVYWRSCGGQIHSSNLSWTLVKIQLTSSSLRLVRLGRLLLFELQQDTNLLIRLNICILVAFIRWIKHKKIQQGYWGMVDETNWIHDSWFMINQKKDHRALVRFNPEFWNQQGLMQNILEDDDWIKASRRSPGLYQSFRFSVCIHQVTFVSQKWGHALCAASAGQGDSATTTLIDW